jgi:hypothetical protein
MKAAPLSLSPSTRRRQITFHEFQMHSAAPLDATFFLRAPHPPPALLSIAPKKTPSAALRTINSKAESSSNFAHSRLGLSPPTFCSRKHPGLEKSHLLAFCLLWYQRK